MICRNAEEAFQAGLTEPCEHRRPPTECPKCQLSGTEITRLLVLHREHLAAPAALPAPRRAA